MNTNIEIIEIKDIAENKLSEALALLNRTQGEGLFNREYLKKKIRNQDSLVLFAFKDKELISVGCAEIIDHFDYYLPFDLDITTRLKDKKVGSLCTLSVREDFQRQGIGQMMTRRRMSWLADKGCDTVLGISWQSGLSNTSDWVFRKAGFQAVKEVEQFFLEGAIRHPFDCPGCKKQPCVCSAILFEYNF